MKKIWQTALVLLVGLGGLSACQHQNATSDSATQTATKSSISPRAQASSKIAALSSANAAKKSELDAQQQQLTQKEKTLKAAPAQQAATASSQPKAATPSQNLADQNYQGQQEITVHQNQPDFTAAQLNTRNGAWTAFSNLDSHNRAGVASALLNLSLMPTDKRTALTWDPTGWHNKRTAHGWLYNRSHLIGFQLSGENNNPKNLITGTTSLNNPYMLAHEMDIAYYLKQSRNHYVRYEVKPIFRGNELLARGVQMRAQSVGDDTVSFNVYIFNVASGMTLNYNDGTSVTGN